MKLIQFQLALLLLPLLFTHCDSNAANQNPINPKTNEDSTSSISYPLNFQITERAPLMVSKDFGASWEAATDQLPEDLQVSFIEPYGTELVIASDNKGVFISSANKTKWASIDDGLPNRKINALHLQGKDIYVGVYRKGIFKTSDEGKTWTSLNYNLDNLNVQSIFKWNQKLFVGTDRGISTLTDNEKKWQAADVQTQVLSIYEYEGKLVAGTSQGTLISLNEGKYWKWIRKRGTVHYTRNIKERIIELVLDGDLIYSDDWGKNWSELVYHPRLGSYVYDIIEAGNYQLISNNYGIHRSKDNGKLWRHIFKTESMAFFDLLVVGDLVYGGTRKWDEYRKRD